MFESGLGRADKLSRRAMIRTAGIAAGSLATASTFNLFPASAQEKASTELPNFTGPGTNPHWNSVGPIVSEPQKVPLILLTDRPIQLETPRNYFSSAFTPNDAFYVRWHLDRIPNAVDLKSWRLRIEGNVSSAQTLSMGGLLRKFLPETIAAGEPWAGTSPGPRGTRVPGG